MIFVVQHVASNERRISLWEYPFFGLTSEYKISYLEQIDALVRVGYDFMALYSMPVYLRNFYFRLAVKRAEEEKRAMDKGRGVSEGTPVNKNAAAKVPSFVANQVSAK